MNCEWHAIDVAGVSVTSLRGGGSLNCGVVLKSNASKPFQFAYSCCLRACFRSSGFSGFKLFQDIGCVPHDAVNLREIAAQPDRRTERGICLGPLGEVLDQ